MFRLEKSYIKAVRYQIVPYSRRLEYLFIAREPTCLPYLFLISSNFFPWLNFEYWITCQLCWFRCKSATVNVLLLQRFCGLGFLLTLLKFSLTEFLWAFFRCIFLLDLRKKATGKKAGKKCSPKLSQKYPSIVKSFKGKCNFSNPDISFRMIRINSCLWVLLLGDNISDLIFDFLFF